MLLVSCHLKKSSWYKCEYYVHVDGKRVQDALGAIREVGDKYENWKNRALSLDEFHVERNRGQSVGHQSKQIWYGQKDANKTSQKVYQIDK